MLFRIAFRNILRSRARSLITLVAIASGCVSLILAAGFIDDTIHLVRESYIRDFLGHVRVFRQGYLTNGLAKPFEYLIEGPDAIADEIRGLPYVRTVVPVMTFGGLLSNGETSLPVVVEGIDPASYERLKRSTSMRRGEFLDSDAYDCLIGEGVARAMAADLGQPLVLLGATHRGALNGMDLTLRGVFHTADKAFDDRAVRIPRALAAKLLRTTDVQLLMVHVEATSRTEETVRSLRELIAKAGWQLEVKPWNELSEADYIFKVVTFYERLFAVLRIIIFIVVILSILNTMNMAVLERIGEIGTLMALGLKRPTVIRLFVLEGVLLGILGGLAGCLIGTAFALAISWIGIPMPTPPGTNVQWVARITIVPEALISAIILAAVTAAFSSFFPAWKASRLQVAEALRHNV